MPTAALEREGDSLVLSLIFVVVMFAFGVVGALVSSRMPDNPVGWLFLSLAVLEGAYELAYGYTHYSLGVTALPATAYAAWFADWSSPLSPALIGVAFLLFPDGRLLSRRWRPAAWLCVVAIVPVLAHYALAPGPITEFPSIDNPVGVAGAGFLRDLSPDLFIAAILGSAAVAVLQRLRRSRGVEREQLKWFALAAAMIPTFLVLGALGSAMSSGEEGMADYVAGFVFAVILWGCPSPPGSRSCATGSTTSTWSSTARWSTAG